MNSKASWILWLKIFGVIALVMGVFAYMTTVTVIFIPFLCAVVLNVVLSPIISMLERRNLQRGHAVLLVFFVFGLILTAGALVLPDYVVKEATHIKEKWPETQVKIERLLHDAQELVNARVSADNQVDFVNEFPKQAKIFTKALLNSLPHILAEGTIALLLIPLFTFFLLRDGRSFKKALVAAVPNRYFEMTLSLLYRVNQQVGNYLRGLTMEAVADTIVCTFLCIAFGIPNPLIIGMIAGSTTVAPVAGMVISIAICPLVALFSWNGDPTTILVLVALVIVLTHVIDNVFIAPLIMGHSVHMHPAAVIVSIIVAGKLFGVLGIVLAVPTVSILRVLIQEGYSGIKSNEYYLKGA